MKTWWQVYYFDNLKDKIVCFGFSTKGDYICDHPDKYMWSGSFLSEYKPILLSIKAQVVKICDQN